MKVPRNGIIRDAAKAIAEGLLGTAFVVDPNTGSTHLCRYRW